MGADAEIVRQCLVGAAKAAGPSIMDEAGKAYLNGYWEWLRAHLPRMSTSLACSFARQEVAELSALVARGGRPGAPPAVPDWLLASLRDAQPSGPVRRGPELGTKPIAGGSAGRFSAPRTAEPEPGTDNARQTRTTQGELF